MTTSTIATSPRATFSWRLLIVVAAVIVALVATAALLVSNAGRATVQHVPTLHVGTSSGPPLDCNFTFGRNRAC